MTKRQPFPGPFIRPVEPINVFIAYLLGTALACWGGVFTVRNALAVLGIMVAVMVIVNNIAWKRHQRRVRAYVQGCFDSAKAQFESLDEVTRKSA